MKTALAGGVALGSIVFVAGANILGCANDDSAQASDENALVVHPAPPNIDPTTPTKDEPRTASTGVPPGKGGLEDAGVTDASAPEPDRDAEASTSPCPDWRCTTGCNDLIAFPGSRNPASAQAKADGYYIEAAPQYAYLKRHVVMTVRWAACEVARTRPGTAPLALSDMSQADGRTPGTDVGFPRHPSTTHRGNDLDIAYYQTDGTNNSQIVCGDGSDRNPNGVPGVYNDGAFCTVASNIVDWPRQTWFFAKMADSPQVRVFGIDQTMVSTFRAAFDRFLTDGLVTRPAFDRMSILGYGAAGGWHYHHHHTHMSYVNQ